jgi:hypothetical protein
MGAAAAESFVLGRCPLGDRWRQYQPATSRLRPACLARYRAPSARASRLARSSSGLSSAKPTLTVTFTGPCGPGTDSLAALQSELLGPAGVTRHATSFDRSDLLQALCRTLPAGLPVDHRHLEDLADLVLAARDTVPLLTRDDDGQRRYPTAELLATERRALALTGHLLRQPGAPMDAAVVAAATDDSRLSAEQSE